MWEKLFLKSVRAKLFFTLCIVILMIIGFFVIINNVMLEAIYYYSKYNAVLDAYNFINENIPKEFLEEEGFDLAVQHQQQPQRGNISDTEAVELVHGELVAALFDLVLYKFSTDLIGHHEGHQ